MRKVRPVVRPAIGKALIVSPYFPPSSVAGVHRARHLAKHLPRNGWTPVIVCVDERLHEERLDEELAQLVPGATEVLRVGAMPAYATRLIGVGDLGLRAFPMLRAGVLRRLAEGDIDVVFISGFPFYPMMLANEVKRRFDVPVVLDFQDPWVSAWGAEQPPLSKAGISHRVACRLEGRCLVAADFVTSVSEIQNDEMRARHPWMRPENMTAIPIGGDPDDFLAARASYGPGHVQRDNGPINLNYVGTCLPRSEPLLRALFRGFRRLLAARPEAARIRLNFIGTSNQANDGSTLRVRPLAESEGVGAAVTESPARVPYLEALRHLANADGVLVIGSDEPHYTASKIYPVLMSGVPYVSLFHPDSSAHAILQAAGGGVAIPFPPDVASSSIERSIETALCDLAFRGAAMGKADRRHYAAYEASAIAADFASIFDRVVDSPKAERPS